MGLEPDLGAEDMSSMGRAVSRKGNNGKESVEVGRNEAEAEVVPGT